MLIAIASASVKLAGVQPLAEPALTDECRKRLGI